MRTRGERLEKKKKASLEKFIEHVFNELENVHIALFSNEQSLYTREAEGLIFFFFFPPSFPTARSLWVIY